MNNRLFVTPLICSGCGGALNSFLACPFCGTGYEVNWAAAMPALSDRSVSKKGYYPMRDCEVDAIILARIGKYAAQEDVEVALHLETRNSCSCLNISVRDKRSGEWVRAGTITGNRSGGYTITSFEDGGTFEDELTYHLGWTEPFNGIGPRMYTVFDPSERYFEIKDLHGAQELYEGYPLKLITKSIVDNAFKLQDRREPRPWWQRLGLL